MRRLPAVLALALAAFVAVLPVASAQTTDKDCPDFTSQSAAQRYFDDNGGSPSNNVDRLDADHDGIACEDQDYPNGGEQSGEGNGGGAERLPFTGPGDTLRLLAVGLLAVGLLLVRQTRYRPQH